MKINFIAPVKEISGYGEFARNVISGLVSVGADIKVQPIKINNDSDGLIDQSLIGRHSKPDACIICTVPTLAQQFRHPSSKNILYTMWEASRLPEAWAEPCNKMDQVWVPSKHNVELFSKALKVPVLYAPPPLALSKLDGIVRPQRSVESPFVFYSIFQWTERKNPSGLIRAYWAAFTGQDDVVLRIKAYIRNPLSNELAQINAEISNLKRAVRLRHYPKIEVIGQPMTSQEIIQFHLDGDCFVSATRGEGLGLGLIEAMALGTTCIASETSGHLDFARENCHSVRTTQSPTFGMGDYAPWYTGDMMWDDVDLGRLTSSFKEARKQRHSGSQTFEKLAREDVVRIYDPLINSRTLLTFCSGQIE